MSYYEKNREYCNEKSKNYYYTNRDKILEQRATYSDKTNEYSKWYYYEVLRKNYIKPPKYINVPKPPKERAPKERAPKEPKIPAKLLKKMQNEVNNRPFKDFSLTPQGTFKLNW
jgi:hypothetical protein